MHFTVITGKRLTIIISILDRWFSNVNEYYTVYFIIFLIYCIYINEKTHVFSPWNIINHSIIDSSLIISYSISISNPYYKQYVNAVRYLFILILINTKLATYGLLVVWPKRLKKKKQKEKYASKIGWFKISLTFYFLFQYF